jgi:hypothetical protein
MSTESHESVMSLSPEYYFHYTKFCLSTHFIQHINSANLNDEDVRRVRRCVDAARNVLQLGNRTGPKQRDELRYFPGFLFLTLSFCSTFILKAIQLLPGTFERPEQDLERVKTIAQFMVDLGSHGALAAGSSLMLAHKRTTQILEQRLAPSADPSLQAEEVVLDQMLWQDVFDWQFFGPYTCDP